MEDSSFERRRVPVRRKGEMRVWRLQNWGLRVRLCRTSRREGLLSCSPFRENDFEDGHNQFYHFLEHDPAILKCFNFRGATNDNEPKSAAVVDKRLTKLMTAILEAYSSDDRFETFYQIALAIKKEVEDLEAAGINVIQIDEAALREGLPLHKSEHAFYLDWAVHSFRITNVGVKDTTQVVGGTVESSLYGNQPQHQLQN